MKYKPYKNEFLEWERSKKIISKSAIHNKFIEKLRIKCLKNIDLLCELPFYNGLSIEKISKAFERYARSYKIRLIDSKDPLVQLTPSNQSIEDLFKNLLRETEGFKYQTPVKLLLMKY